MDRPYLDSLVLHSLWLEREQRKAFDPNKGSVPVGALVSVSLKEGSGIKKLVSGSGVVSSFREGYGHISEVSGEYLGYTVGTDKNQVLIGSDTCRISVPFSRIASHQNLSEK